MSEHANFGYQQPADPAGMFASISVFNDEAFGRSQLVADLEEAGFRVLSSGNVAQLLRGEPALLGDIVMLQCLGVDAQSMAALARLDLKIAEAGAQLIVVTSLPALDDVFACFDQSAPQFLVAPSRTELILASGRAAADMSRGRVRELTKEDRTALARLSQQVEQIARQLEGFPGHGSRANADDMLLNDARPAFRGFNSNMAAEPLARPSLPDPRIVREIIRRRQARARYFDIDLFADPAWDILLDLTAADAERVRVSVTSLCIASGVPATTALRWIRQMTDAELLARVEDTSDKRRVFISLTDKARDAMARYFLEVANPATDFAA